MPARARTFVLTFLLFWVSVVRGVAAAGLEVRSTSKHRCVSTTQATVSSVLWFTF